MPIPDCVLIVNENAAIRHELRSVLEHRGFEVAEAATGGEGLVRLGEQDFGALLLGFQLPDMSGSELVRQLRADARWRLLPAIHVSTAAIAPADVAAGLDAGADTYLTYPVDPDVLLATLRSLLRARRAEDALREAEAKFREIFRQINVPVAVLDAGLCTREANDAFKRLVAETTGSEPLECVLAGQLATSAALKIALERGVRWQGVFVLGTGAARRITEWRVTPYTPGLGLVVVEDVTEHHAREAEQRQELEYANTELAFQIAERERTEGELMQAQKMDALGKLTGGIAHDFNNLLTTILSGLDLIDRAISAGNADKAMHYIEIASGSARRAAALTQRMLAFARKQPLDPQAFDVGQRVRSLEDMLRRAIGENIRFELSLADGPLIALADVNQFENVVLNLVINARDALAGQGRIEIRAERVAIAKSNELAAGNYISVKVIDNGVGIPPALLSKVFEPFFTTKPQGEGTGLGLSMTYGFARQSGGLARIESELGEGTVIELLLPEGAGSPMQEVAPGQAIHGKGSERILVVDDSESVRMMVKEMLLETGYQVVEVKDACEALLELGSERPLDLLLTDVGLPGMNGRELAHTARLARPGLPVLFVTGYSETALARSRFLADGMALLPKPFSVNDLLQAVRGMFN